MRKLVLIIALSLSCGGDDELSAQEGCNQAVDILCDKFFSCFTKEEADAAKDFIGLNAADCKVKLKAAECGADNVKCNLGETYHADKASECVNGYKGLSCTDIKKGANLPEPAACTLICTK